MLIYKLIEYSNIFSKTERLWKYYRNEPALDNNNNIIDFPTNNNTILLQKKNRENKKRCYKRC